MRFGTVARSILVFVTAAGAVGGAGTGCGAKSDLFGPEGGAGTGAGGAGGSGGTGGAGGSVGGSSVGGSSVGGSSTGGSGGSLGCAPGDQTTCYDGPAGTLGVGQCAAGLTTCDSNGQFGPCLGQVLPSPEICGNAVDESCDGLAPSCDGQEWSVVFAQDAFPIGMTTDIDGGAVVFGGLTGDVTFAPGLTFSSEGHADFFLLRLDPGGGVTWARHLPTEGFGVSAIGSIETDPQQRFVIAGGAGAAVDFGNGLVPGNGAFVAKMDLEGKPIWVTRIADSWARAAVDAAGNITAVGWSECIGQFTCGDQFHLTKLDASGNVLWQNAYPQTTWLHPMGIDVDSTGASYFAAELIGNTQMGPIAVSCPSGCALLAKHDANGTPLWAQVYIHDQASGLQITYPIFFGTGGTTAGYNGTAGATGNGVRVTPDDSVLFSGTFAVSMSLGGAPVTGGGANMFLAKLDPAGNHVWSRGLGGPLANTPGAVAVTPSGQILVSGVAWQDAGGTPGHLDFGGGPLPVGFGIGKLDANGAHAGSHGYLGGYPDSWLQLAPDPTGGAYFAFRAMQPVDLGNGPELGMVVMRTQP